MSKERIVTSTHSLPSKLVLSKEDYKNRAELSICMGCLRVYKEPLSKCECGSGVALSISHLEASGINVLEEKL